MKPQVIFALSAATFAGPSFAAPDLSSCEMSVYQVNAEHSTLGAEILAPDQVISIARFQTDFPSEVAWQVKLTSSGTASNSRYTSKNVGKKIAILCNGEEVARPTIVAPSGATFVFTTGEQP